MSDAVTTLLVPISLFAICVIGLGFFLLLLGRLCNPLRPNPVKQMPYESGMDPVHDARRRFDVRFHLVAIAFIIFDVELLFLYPWAVLLGESRSGEIAAVVAESGPMPGAGLREQSEESGVVSPGVEGSGGTAVSSETTPGGLHTGRGAGSTVQAGGAGLRPPAYLFELGIVFLLLLTIGFIYDWRKGVFSWR